MGLGGGDGRPEVSFGEQVRNRVVDQHGIEGAAQPQGAHIPLVVVHAGIQPPGECQHRLGDIGGGGLKFSGQVGEGMSSPGAQLQELVPPRPQPFPQLFAPAGGVFGGLLGGAD